MASKRRPLRLAAALGAVAVAAMISLPGAARSAGSFVDLPDVTYLGMTEGGGTLLLIFSQDLSQIIRVEARDIEITAPSGFGCSVSLARDVDHKSPPEAVTNDSFLVSIPHDPPVYGSLRITGTFDGQGNLAGTVYFHYTLPAECDTPSHSWTATGTIETPPDPSDLRYDGGLVGAAGQLTLWTTTVGDGITAAVLDGFAASPCTDDTGPLTLRTFFDPPVPLGPGGTFTFTVKAPSGLWIWYIGVEGVVLADGSASATVSTIPLYLGDPVCEASWQGTLDATDTDQDGCIDPRELGDTPMLGGLRNPKDFWDFFDTPDPNATPQRDRAITLADVLRVMGRFGETGDPTIDPLSTPEKTGYHPAYDRGGQIGANVWEQAPADGAIALPDVLAIAGQFGHSCA